MTETMLTDFEEALLAYIESRASDHQQQMVQKRLQSDPALRTEVLAMIADRMSLQTSPRFAMPQALQSTQTIADRIQREHRQRRVLAKIRYGAMAAAALLLASAISFRIIWPASGSVASRHSMVALSSRKTEALPLPPPRLASAATFKQAKVIRIAKRAIMESAAGKAPSRAGPLILRPMAGAPAPWTLVIAVKNSAQDRQLHALLENFTRQNQPLAAADQQQRVHRLTMKAAALPLPLTLRRATTANKSIQAPQRFTTPRQDAIRAVPAGDLLLMLKPAQVQLLRAQFTVVQLMAPAQGLRKPAAAFGGRVGHSRALKVAGPPTTNPALPKETLGQAALQRRNMTQSAQIPAQAEPFIIEILPPRQR